MKTVIPDYYPRFACLMGACRHTCCAGWEIDVDEESLARYRQLPGTFGARIRESLEEKDGVTSFRLGDGERCPFLREDGLCDMIVHLGKDSLCQICADHPRFRNYFSDRVEIGLGLCCEAAAALILKNPSPVTLCTLDTDGETDAPDEEEQALLALRERWILTAQDRRLPFSRRLKALEKELTFPLQDVRAYLPLLRTLETLDDSWQRQLDLLESASPLPLDSAFDAPMEQLLVYLLYRHVPAALIDGDAEGKLGYAILICRLLSSILGCRMAMGEHVTPDALCDLARMYSGEIEYSDENLFALFDELAGT
ncbi:MAG: hypothetical protein E7326_05745 [Clostridiales bacterium]|nr:hypothetical protein [Clostridiales bacterium]